MCEWRVEGQVGWWQSSLNYISLDIFLVLRSGLGTRSRCTMKFGDLLFKATSASLGIATLGTGIWLISSMAKGFVYHRKVWNVCGEG